MRDGLCIAFVGVLVGLAGHASPATAAPMDRTISRYSAGLYVLPPFSLAANARFSLSLKHRGFICKHPLQECFEPVLPPRLLGHPSNPAQIEKKARMIKGTVIDLGDSWMWCPTS